jgi:hypothetical protein
MATSNSALSVALRKRWPGSKGKRDLMRALGIDAVLLPGGGGTAAPDVDGTKARMADFKVKLSEFLHKERHALPEEDGGGLIGKIIALIDGDGAEDAESDRTARVKAFLKSRNLSDADVEEILLRMAEIDPAAADVLPSSGPAAIGGHLSGRSRALGERPFAGRQAADEAFAAMFPNAGRIGIGFDHGCGRARPALGPSEAKVAEFNALFPDAARIQAG